MDLASDWTNEMRRDLLARGLTPPVKDEEVGFSFWNLQKRLVAARPRHVHRARGLQCPSSLRSGFDEVRRKTVAGEDLKPHLSRGLKNAAFYDLLLNDWGICHLHLGTKVEQDGFVDRTGNVLFALFRPDDAYFIAIELHGSQAKDVWGDVQFLEEIDANWPYLLNDRVLRGAIPSRAVPTNPGRDEIVAARASGVQPAVTVGRRVLVGNVTTARVSSDVVSTAIAVYRRMRNFQDGIVGDKARVLEHAKASGAAVGPLKLSLYLADEIAYAQSSDQKATFKLGPITP